MVKIHVVLPVSEYIIVHARYDRGDGVLRIIDRLSTPLELRMVNGQLFKRIGRLDLHMIPEGIGSIIAVVYPAPVKPIQEWLKANNICGVEFIGEGSP